MKLTLLRHGITEGNRKNLCYGSTDLPLLPEGIAELRQTVQTHHYPTAMHYYTSGMRRTEETFSLIYGDTPHEVLTGLREVNFGELEMVPFADLQNDPACRQWVEDLTGEMTLPGGESFQGVRRRVLEALEPLIRRDEDAVCVMHGGAMSTALSFWFPDHPLYAFMPHPGTGFQVTFEAGKPVEFHPVPVSTEV